MNDIKTKKELYNLYSSLKEALGEEIKHNISKVPYDYKIEEKIAVQSLLYKLYILYKLPYAKNITPQRSEKTGNINIQYRFVLERGEQYTLQITIALANKNRYYIANLIGISLQELKEIREI